MNAFQPPKERLTDLTMRVLTALNNAPEVELADPKGAAVSFRTALVENLRQEHELEQEVFETLKKHGQQIYEENADFYKMLQEGKRMLAKKKGFTL